MRDSGWRGLACRRRLRPEGHACCPRSRTLNPQLSPRPHFTDGETEAQRGSHCPQVAQQVRCCLSTVKLFPNDVGRVAQAHSPSSPWSRVPPQAVLLQSTEGWIRLPSSLPLPRATGQYQQGEDLPVEGASAPAHPECTPSEHPEGMTHGLGVQPPPLCFISTPSGSPCPRPVATGQVPYRGLWKLRLPPWSPPL